MKKIHLIIYYASQRLNVKLRDTTMRKCIPAGERNNNRDNCDKCGEVVRKWLVCRTMCVTLNHIDDHSFVGDSIEKLRLLLEVISESGLSVYNFVYHIILYVIDVSTTNEHCRME